MTHSLRFVFAASLVALLCPIARPQPVHPPGPEKYRVLLRYSIVAPRDPHVILYDAMIEHLKGLDFEFIPPLDKRPNTDREDPGKNMLEGLIEAGKVRAILHNPSVASILLLPSEFKPPAGNQPVAVRLELVAGFSPSRQRDLADQARLLLAQLGFREAMAYDHRGDRGRTFSRLVGVMPAGQVEFLLKDLRRQPAGWLGPKYTKEDLPTPLRNISPIRFAEVLLYLPAVGEPAPPPPRGQFFLEKIAADLWGLLQRKDQGSRPMRYQVVLAKAPGPFDKKWRDQLAAAAPGFFIEGQLGPMVTGIGPVSDVPRLAALPEVSLVRLPQPARAEITPTRSASADNQRILRQTGLDKLHDKKHRGKGVRLAILDADFRGWEQAVKDGSLPKGTRLVDLTTERNPDVFPDPFPGDPKQFGHGTQCAQAAALAAPEADFVLLRIDPVAPCHFQQIVQHMRGSFLSEHLSRRQDEVLAARARLQRDRAEILKDRKAVLDYFDDERELERNFGFLGPVYGWVFSPREWIRQRLAYQVEAERQFVEKEKRLHQFFQELQGLKGIAVVACLLGWNDGYPLGGASGLSRWLEELPRPRPLWFQSAGHNQAQSWAGLFHDADQNGVMEFAPPQAPLPKGRWTPELNFLGWQPHEGKRTAELPEKARLRISLQWREPHDPGFQPRPGEPDFFLLPLTQLRLVLLRQRDPEGKKLPSDDFEVVAYSNALPQRLIHEPSFAVYEIALEQAIDRPGRYALRLEKQLDSRWLAETDPETGRPMLIQLDGLAPSGTRPPGASTLPAFEKKWELRPRIFVQMVDEANRQLGRPVFLDFSTSSGSIGVPADSRGIISVAAVSLDDKPQPYSSPGPPNDMELAKVPNIFAYDALQVAPQDTPAAFGTSLSTSFAAGLAAALLSSGMSSERLERYLQNRRGKVFRVPTTQK